MVGGSSPVMGAASKPDDAQSPIPNGYIVEPAGNGGWVVHERPDDTRYASILSAAFSNSDDLLAWLARMHGSHEVARPDAIIKVAR